jgi:hypothetical protein
VNARRASWDFPYEPVGWAARGQDGGEPVDVVVATAGSTDERALASLLRGLNDVEVRPLLDRAPLHWTRIRSSTPASRLDIAAALSKGGVLVRYVASALRSSMALAPPLDVAGVEPCKASDWGPPSGRSQAEPSPGPEPWFLGPAGVCVDRSVCGTGAGIRLAVIDDDVADLEAPDLDRLTSIEVARPASASGHAALMVGWASRATRPDGTPFLGVAPDASVRAYCIPKPGTEVFCFPLAVARALLDGADIVVCATYLEATTSPMLDDALQMAVLLGRCGRGAAVLLPTGRETSSPEGSLHASLSLALGDPASDPRVHCVAPSGCDGGWFLWPDSLGVLRPFANRGPAVRWLAPGDDLPYPFGLVRTGDGATQAERLVHAESSGASAVAAGVMALVLSCNPELTLPELHLLLERTTDPPPSTAVPREAFADPADWLPLGRDRDNHDAKCGYGRLNARRACASAMDPVSFGLTAVGEDEAAVAWCTRGDRPYSASLAGWGVRALLARKDLEHSLRVIIRHVRLLAVHPSRTRAHGPDALARQLGLLVRELGRGAPKEARNELDGILDGLTQACLGQGRFGAALERVPSIAKDLWRVSD